MTTISEERIREELARAAEHFSAKPLAVRPATQAVSTAARLRRVGGIAIVIAMTLIVAWPSGTRTPLRVVVVGTTAQRATTSSRLAHHPGTTNTWNEIPNVPKGFGATGDNSLAVVGTPRGFVFMDRIWKKAASTRAFLFDPRASTWTALATYEPKRTFIFAKAVVVGNRVVVLAFDKAMGHWYTIVWNTATKNVIEGPALPYASLPDGFELAAIDDTRVAVAVTFYSSSASFTRRAPIDGVWSYAVGNAVRPPRSWTFEGALPARMDRLYTLLHSGPDLWIVGATQVAANGTMSEVKLYARDARSKQWRRSSDIGVSGQAVGAGWFGDKILVVTYAPEAWLYDPKPDRWVALPAPPIGGCEAYPFVANIERDTVVGYCGPVAILDVQHQWRVIWDDRTIPGPAGPQRVSGGTASGRFMLGDTYTDPASRSGPHRLMLLHVTT